MNSLLYYKTILYIHPLNGKVENEYYQVYNNKHFLLPHLQEIDNKKETAERKHITRNNNKGNTERIKLHKRYIHSLTDHPSYLVSSLPLKIEIDNQADARNSDVNTDSTAQQTERNIASGRYPFHKITSPLSLLSTSISPIMPKASILPSSLILESSITPIPLSLFQYQQKLGKRKVVKDKNRHRILYLSGKNVKREEADNFFKNKFLKNRVMFTERKSLGDINWPSHDGDNMGVNDTITAINKDERNRKKYTGNILHYLSGENPTMVTMGHSDKFNVDWKVEDAHKRIKRFRGKRRRRRSEEGLVNLMASNQVAQS